MSQSSVCLVFVNGVWERESGMQMIAVVRHGIFGIVVRFVPRKNPDLSHDLSKLCDKMEKGVWVEKRVRL